ncbi:MAG: hypothetical protein M1833_005514 [Piccolia ochrophora]|nr:MAG: hypothetical protein M1833_005514 [Piccolia ochrophora]
MSSQKTKDEVLTHKEQLIGKLTSENKELRETLALSVKNLDQANKSLEKLSSGIEGASTRMSAKDQTLEALKRQVESMEAELRTLRPPSNITTRRSTRPIMAPILPHASSSVVSLGAGPSVNPTIVQGLDILFGMVESWSRTFALRSQVEDVPQGLVNVLRNNAGTEDGRVLMAHDSTRWALVARCITEFVVRRVLNHGLLKGYSSDQDQASQHIILIPK